MQDCKFHDPIANNGHVVITFKCKLEIDSMLKWSKANFNCLKRWQIKRTYYLWVTT